MALRGNLTELSATRLLSLISLARKTGTLRLYQQPVVSNGRVNKQKIAPLNEERATITFKEGRLILASAGPHDGSLPMMLHKAGKLNAEQVHIINQRGAKYSDKALALALINANYVTRDDIVHSVRQYTLDIVYDVMTWNQGPFVFEEDVLPPPERITVSIDIKSVIAEGTRHALEVKPFAEELPNLDVVLKFPDDPGDLFQGLSLGVEEWHVVSLVDRKTSIRQIAKSCNMTDAQIRRVVYGLLRKGLVELKVEAASGNSTTRRMSAMLSVFQF